MAKAPPPQGIFPPTAASAPEPSIEAAIGAVLGRESLANERKLAYVRAVVVILSTLLDVVVFFFPEPLIGKASISPAIALFSMGASVLSIILVVMLRSRRAIDWLPWLQVVVPMFDGVLLGGFITNIHPVLGQTQPMILTNITAFCCLLAVSGGMRLRRRSVALTTAVALANFSYAAVLFGLDVAITLFAAFTIFGTGFIARWMADIVRRQIQNEAGRVMMERFLPKPVVEAAFETPLELLQQPRLCQVTVMVTDLRNFTHFAENLAPVEVLKFLNHLQGFQSTIVEAHGGWVNKFMGDGMLAVFGAPDALPGHGDKALRAALEILQQIHRVSPLAIGIGLHSGTVVAGCVGKGSRLEFTVIGDTVNVASRLEALTKQEAYPLLLSQATRQLLGQPDGVISLGLRQLRGRDDPLEVFALQRTGASKAESI
jgi:class 3 adenylate cyclase